MLFRFPHSSWLPACRRLLLLLPALVLAAGLSARSLVKADVQLANNAVLAMYQDEDANMWIGTYDGLHLYNGKNTFVFRMELDNEFSLCSNIVLEIAPAEKGYLWAATSLGINKFSLRERRVVESYMQYVDVENIASDSEGNTVLFSGEDFITCYRPGRAFFEDVYIPGVRAAEIVAVWSEAPRVFCTLGRDGELVRYRLNDGEGKSLVRVSGRQLSARPVRKAFFNGGRLHFVDTSGGLWRYTYKDEYPFVRIHCRQVAQISVIMLFVACEKLVEALFRIGIGDRQEYEFAVCVKPFENDFRQGFRRQFPQAGAAPGSPEVQQHDFATQSCKREIPSGIFRSSEIGRQVALLEQGVLFVDSTYQLHRFFMRGRSVFFLLPGGRSLFPAFGF